MGSSLDVVKGHQVDGNDLAAFRKDFISFVITTEYQVGDIIVKSGLGT